MNRLKKIWSLSAIVGMLISSFPLSIFAETIESAEVVINQALITDTTDQEITETNRVKHKAAVKLKLDWSLAKATLIEENTIVTVNLPANLNFPDQSGSLADGMGNYQVTNQQLLFQFAKNYEETEDGRAPEFTSAKFYEGLLELTAETTAEDLDTETVGFGDNLVSTIYYDKKVDPAADPLEQIEGKQEKKEVQTRAHNPNLNARGVNLFNNIKITDFNGQEYTAERPALYNDNIEIKIDWRLDNNVDIANEDYYTYQLPNYFAVHNAVNGNLIRKNSDGSEDHLGTFNLDKTGLLKVVFNEKAGSLSERAGTIDLKTELKLDSSLVEQEIKTGICDDTGKEISIVVPIYHSDIAKKGFITDQATIDWYITFNQDSKKLTNVEVEDVLPEQEFAYTIYDNKTVVSVELYNEETSAWEKAPDGFFTFDETTKIFEFHETIATPVRISFNAKIVDLTKKSFTNTATIKSDQFSEKSVSATVSYDEQENYKRAVSYDASKGEVNWEVAVSFKNNEGYLLDKTYEGKSAEARHYLVKESIVVTDKAGKPVDTSRWTLSDEESIEKNGQLVQFKLTFKDAGNYLITYKTKLFDSLFENTTIKNYMTVKDGEESHEYKGQTTIGPTGSIGVKKSEGGSTNVNLEKIQTRWITKFNTEKKTIHNVVLTDKYHKSNGSNKSALELVDDDAETTAEEDKFKISDLSGKILEKGKDYDLERLTATTANGLEYEAGFKVTFKGEYQTITDELTMEYTTKFDIRKQIDQLHGATNRLDNSVVVEYISSDDVTYKEGSEATRWLLDLWLNNASKGGFFVAKGESVPAGLKKYIGWDPTHNPFSEAEAPKDSVYWLATFNYYKEILEENSMVVEKLGEGQTLRDLTICETVLIHNGRGIAAFKDKLEEGKDYKYEVKATGEIVITFLKETNKTFSVALAVDASEEIFKYKNYAELYDAGDKGSVHTEGEVIKSAKDKWLTKDGLQDEENNRLVNWQVLINQDARTVNDAIVTDTIKLNQQSFILNEQDKVSVRVYEAIAKDDGFEKGQEVTKGFNTSITMNAVDGTQTMTINFEESIDSPYIIEYQTKLDPGIVNSEKITNDVKLNGSATEIHQVTKEITIKSTDGSGTSTGVNGALRIKKIDSVSKEAISKSTHFEILRKNSEGKYETFISDVEVKENKIVVDDGTLVEELSNLRYGDYAIREIDAPEGYIKDDTLYKFTISTNNQTHIFELENTKKDADPTTVKLKAKKELTGKELSAGQFSFKLLDSDKNELQTKSNDKDGQIFFDEITYDKAGTYEYTISEAIPTEKETGIRYDETKYKVTVTVEEKAGKLEATVVYENVKAGEVPTFKNTYKALPGTIQLEAKKELSGRPLKADEFSFTLKGDGGVDQTKKNAADGKVIFDEITYDKAGIYEYTISEAIPTEKETGVTYDDTKYKVTVTVEEKAGKLEVTVVYENIKAGEVPTFKNTYKALPGTIQLEARKELSGRSLKADDFSFTLKGDGGVDQTKKNAKDGKVLFDAITYDQAGTYEYTISEVVPATPETGVTYDKATYRVKVTVEEKSGKLEATVEYENVKTGEVPVFKNIYKALPGTIQLEAKKELSGRPLKADEFSFTLKGDGGVDQTKKNAKDGKVLFDAIKYDQAGTYEYTISEKIPAIKETGVTYDDTKYKVTVTVEEKAGKLEATAVYETGEVPTFKNAYKALPGSIQLEAKKELDGRSLKADEFSFKLKGDNVDQTKKNAADGKILFDQIDYDQAGTYEYTISEMIPADKETGLTYDEAVYKVTVTVVEEAGKLKAKVNYESLEAGEIPTFKNVYKALPGSIQLEAKKELDGRSLKADEFNFNLKGDNVDQTKKNAADGKVTFDEITYDQAGTYEYTISEAIPTAKETGITYDDTQYKVSVKVEENAGMLEAVVTYENLEDGELPVFRNLYTPEKEVPTGELLLKKIDSKTGRTLANAEFKLVDDKGQVVTGKEKIVTGEDGSIFIKGLADGEYQIIETKAPDGYLIDETPIKFSVKNNQPSKKEINQENDPLKLPETGNSSNKTTNVKTTYRNATGKRTTVSKRLPSTGSIQSKGLVILGLFFLAMFGLVVFGKRKNI